MGVPTIPVRLPSSGSSRANGASEVSGSRDPNQLYNDDNDYVAETHILSSDFFDNSRLAKFSSDSWFWIKYLPLGKLPLGPIRPSETKAHVLLRVFRQTQGLHCFQQSLHRDLE